MFSKPTAVSLFTGAGGSDLGLDSLGFDILFANDNCRYARELYLENLPFTDYVLGDVTEIKSFPAADLLVGCYPCQGFSQGGKRDAENSLNYLYREFDRALRHINPKAFIVENVSGMRSKQNQKLLRNQITRFRLAGYRVQWKELDAKQFGVAQDRRRIFIVGVNSDFGFQYCFPEATHGPGREWEYLTIKDAIGDLPKWPSSEFLEDPFHWYYLSRNRYRGWTEQSKTIVGHARHIPLHPISPPLKRLDTDTWRFAHDGPARRFSYVEAARIQGFPKNFRFPDSSGIRAKYRAIGNAVPPPLFEQVAGNLIPLLLA